MDLRCSFVPIIQTTLEFRQKRDEAASMPQSIPRCGARVEGRTNRVGRRLSSPAEWVRPDKVADTSQSFAFLSALPLCIAMWSVLSLLISYWGSAVLLAETAASAGRAAADGTGGSTKTEIWLWRQSGANSSPHANSLFAGKKQGISAKIGVFGRLTSRKCAVFQYITDEIP
jgi:hypothetical protein